MWKTSTALSLFELFTQNGVDKDNFINLCSSTTLKKYPNNDK
jgi:hypothetical protein